MKGAIYCLGNLVSSNFIDVTEKYDLMCLFMNKMDGKLNKKN